MQQKIIKGIGMNEFYVDMITYPCPKPNAGLANHCL